MDLLHLMFCACSPLWRMCFCKVVSAQNSRSQAFSPTLSPPQPPTYPHTHLIPYTLTYSPTYSPTPAHSYDRHCQPPKTNLFLRVTLCELLCSCMCAYVNQSMCLAPYVGRTCVEQVCLHAWDGQRSRQRWGRRRRVGPPPATRQPQR